MQALLFITLCRICGIPARWQSGRATNPEALTTGNHDWAQLWVDGTGWCWVDCSAGGGCWRAGAEDRRRFYFGSMPPSRLVMASEFQCQTHVPMRYMRFDPYDNQNGEVETLNRRLERREYSVDADILSYEEL